MKNILLVIISFFTLFIISCNQQPVKKAIEIKDTISEDKIKGIAALQAVKFNTKSNLDNLNPKL